MDIISKYWPDFSQCPSEDMAHLLKTLNNNSSVWIYQNIERFISLGKLSLSQFVDNCPFQPILSQYDDYLDKLNLDGLLPHEPVNDFKGNGEPQDVYFNPNLILDPNQYSFMDSYWTLFEQCWIEFEKKLDFMDPFERLDSLQKSVGLLILQVIAWTHTWFEKIKTETVSDSFLKKRIEKPIRILNNILMKPECLYNFYKIRKQVSKSSHESFETDTPEDTIFKHNRQWFIRILDRIHYILRILDQQPKIRHIFETFFKSIAMLYEPDYYYYQLRNPISQCKDKMKEHSSRCEFGKRSSKDRSQGPEEFGNVKDDTGKRMHKDLSQGHIQSDFYSSISSDKCTSLPSSTSSPHYLYGYHLIQEMKWTHSLSIVTLIYDMINNTRTRTLSYYYDQLKGIQSYMHMDKVTLYVELWKNTFMFDIQCDVNSLKWYKTKCLLFSILPKILRMMEADDDVGSFSNHMDSKDMFFETDSMSDLKKESHGKNYASFCSLSSKRIVFDKDYGFILKKDPMNNVEMSIALVSDYVHFYTRPSHDKVEDLDEVKKDGMENPPTTTSLLVELVSYLYFYGMVKIDHLRQLVNDYPNLEHVIDEEANITKSVHLSPMMNFGIGKVETLEEIKNMYRTLKENGRKDDTPFISDSIEKCESSFERNSMDQNLSSSSSYSLDDISKTLMNLFISLRTQYHLQSDIVVCIMKLLREENLLSLCTLSRICQELCNELHLSIFILHDQYKPLLYLMMQYCHQYGNSKGREAHEKMNAFFPLLIMLIHTKRSEDQKRIMKDIILDENLKGTQELNKGKDLKFTQPDRMSSFGGSSKSSKSPIFFEPFHADEYLLSAEGTQSFYDWLLEYLSGYRSNHRRTMNSHSLLNHLMSSEWPVHEIMEDVTPNELLYSFDYLISSSIKITWVQVHSQELLKDRLEEGWKLVLNHHTFITPLFVSNMIKEVQWLRVLKGGDAVRHNAHPSSTVNGSYNGITNGVSHDIHPNVSNPSTYSNMQSQPFMSNSPVNNTTPSSSVSNQYSIPLFLLQSTIHACILPFRYKISVIKATHGFDLCTLLTALNFHNDEFSVLYPNSDEDWIAFNLYQQSNVLSNHYEENLIHFLFHHVLSSQVMAVNVLPLKYLGRMISSMDPLHTTRLLMEKVLKESRENKNPRISYPRSIRASELAAYFIHTCGFSMIYNVLQYGIEATLPCIKSLSEAQSLAYMCFGMIHRSGVYRLKQQSVYTRDEKNVLKAMETFYTLLCHIMERGHKVIHGSNPKKRKKDKRSHEELEKNKYSLEDVMTPIKSMNEMYSPILSTPTTNSPFMEMSQNETPSIESNDKESGSYPNKKLKTQRISNSTVDSSSVMASGMKTQSPKTSMPYIVAFPLTFFQLASKIEGMSNLFIELNPRIIHSLIQWENHYVVLNMIHHNSI